MKADVFGAPHIDPAVYGAEEEVRFVAEADFGAGIPYREPCKATDVRDYDIAGASVIRRCRTLISNWECRIRRKA